MGMSQRDWFMPCTMLLPLAQVSLLELPHLCSKSLTQERLWWRTTPVTTKARHYGTGGANTHARPAPRTSKDKRCRISLYRLRTPSRYFELEHMGLSFFPLLMHFLYCTCFSGSAFISLPLRFLSGPSLSGLTQEAHSLWTFYSILCWNIRFVGVK